jgi:hypothetical protein
MNLDSTCLVTVMCHYRRLARHVEPDSEPRQRPIMAYLGYPACTECAFPITVSRVQNPEKKKDICNLLSSSLSSWSDYRHSHPFHWPSFSLVLSSWQLPALDTQLPAGSPTRTRHSRAQTSQRSLSNRLASHKACFADNVSYWQITSGN